MQDMMEITDKLQDSVKYEDECGHLHVQRVHYEWQPVHCTHFKGYGHCVEQCRKTKPQVWVPKPSNQHVKEDPQEWTVVSSKKGKG